MEKIIEFSPAYDKRNPDPNKDYGIHGMDLKFVLKGEEGAVQFLVYTNWYLPHVKDELADKASKDSGYIKLFFTPIGADIGYHSKVQMYEGQEAISSDCPYINGECFYDGSSLRAYEFMDEFIAKGDDAVWEMLENYYQSVFENANS